MPHPIKAFTPVLAPSIIAWAALAFWAVSYAIFSYRVELRDGGGLDALFTLRRLLTTGLGALMFAGVLKHIGGRPRGDLAHPLWIVAAIVPASLVLIGFRLAIDPLVSSAPLPLGTHVRWVIVWAGYFGLGLGVAVAWKLYARRSRAELADPGVSDWLAEALADEMAGLAPAQRLELAQRLVARAGYRVADDPCGIVNARLDAAEGLAARLGRTS